MSQYRINERRVYEGEWVFYCTNSGCRNGVLVEYSFNEYEADADSFLHGSSGPIHTSACCENCRSPLEWAGYSGGSPISDKLVALLENNHFMASTVIISAIIENSLNNLLWAALVDSGVSAEKANKVTEGRMGRIEMTNIISSLVGFKIKDISFKSRNLVAHGKGFLIKESYYQKELLQHIEKIFLWVLSIFEEIRPKNFNPTECERWALFMIHWSEWLKTHVKPHFLEIRRNSEEG